MFHEIKENTLEVKEKIGIISRKQKPKKKKKRTEILELKIQYLK